MEKSIVNPSHDEGIQSLDVSNTENQKLLQKAYDIFVKSNKISKSLLQRNLKIGYAKASEIIECMKRNGMIDSINSRVGAQLEYDESKKMRNLDYIRKNVILMRATDEMTKHLDNLVSLSIAGSRSEAVSMLVTEGIKANAEKLANIEKHIEKIKDIRSDLDQTTDLSNFGIMK